MSDRHTSELVGLARKSRAVKQLCLGVHSRQTVSGTGNHFEKLRYAVEEIENLGEEEQKLGA